MKADIFSPNRITATQDIVDVRILIYGGGSRKPNNTINTYKHCDPLGLVGQMRIPPINHSHNEAELIILFFKRQCLLYTYQNNTCNQYAYP